MFSNVFNTIWSNPAYRILEKQIHGETVVLAENEGRLCAAKRVGNEFVSLILSGIPTKVNTALDKALTCAQLKDSNLQLVGPQLTVLPRMLGGAPNFPLALLTSPEDLKWWFQQHPEFTDLNLFNSEIDLEKVTTLAAALPYSQVLRLDLSINELGCEGVKVIANVLPHTQVSHLNLVDNGIGLEGIKALCEVLPLTQIVSLTLGDNIGIEGAKAITAVLPRSRLSHLGLLWGNIQDAGVKALAAVLPHCLLSNLNINSNGITSDGMNVLISALPFSWITKLDLESCEATDEENLALAKVLPLSRISYLSLFKNKIQDEGGRGIAAALPNSSLSGLYIGGYNNEITEETLKALAGVLPSSPLSHLHVEDCEQLKEESIQVLIEALPRSQLVEVRLRGLKINIDNAKALAVALPQSKVVYLNLQSTNLETEGIKAIATTLPNTRVSILDLMGNSIKDEGIIALADVLPVSRICSLFLDSLEEAGEKALLNAMPNSRVVYCLWTSPGKTVAEQYDTRFEEFFNVCRNGTLEEVKQLLDQGIPIHVTDYNSGSGDTALHIAVERNHRDLVTLLLKRKAALIRNYRRETPLDIARELGYHDLVEMLEAGLPDAIPVPDPVPVPKDYYCSITQEIMHDPVLLAGDGVTYEREAIEKWLETSDLSPLHGSPLASKLLIPNQFCKGQIQDLIEKHSHLEKETYIPEASKKACLTALAERNVNSLKDLLKDKRLLPVEFPNGLLIELACQSSLEMLKTVIEAYRARPHFSHELCAKAAQGLGVEGVSLLFHLLPKKVPTGLLPALFEAIKLQSGAYLEALLEMGVSPNSRDLRGSYPLHRAVEAGSKELITILMEHDANLKAVDREERTPLQLAEQLGRLDLVRHIKQKKIEIKLRPLLAPIQEQINAQGRVIQQLRGALFETRASLGNIVPLLGANPSLSSVADELVALRKRIDQHFS